jgi:outer membrane protein OmpA-like peptidoglycan-associated protein/tetratricopeptide (TPR) repeat protein
MKTIVTIFLLLSAATLFAQQDARIDKDKFFSGNEGFKEAWNAIKEADKYYADGKPGAYMIALDNYLTAYKYNSNNAELNYKIGVCYLKTVEKIKALTYLNKASTLNKNVASDFMYFLARAHHLNYEFDKAIDEYTAFKNSLSPELMKIYEKELIRRLEECKNGKEIIKKPVRAFIDNLGPEINSSFPDYTPLITADNSMMIFTSRRQNTTGGEICPDDEMFYEDIYYSNLIKGKWQKAENIGEPLNGRDNDATVGLTPDGQQLFIYKGNKGNGDLFESNLTGKDWGQATALPGQINTSAKENSATLSYEGNFLYFSSTRKENSYGGSDIFVSKRIKKNKWGDAQNIGAVVNTPYNEEGVFMLPDGKTLYFCSDGHNSIGGYDIFKTVLQPDGTWSKPENLGYPVNTPDDDRDLVLTASGRIAYYSSVREDGFGFSDIYKITFLGPEKPIYLGTQDELIASIANPVSEVSVKESVKIETIRLTIVKGIITDSITHQPLAAQIEIVDNDKNEIISTQSSNSTTGKYLFSLPSGKNYGIAVKLDNYLFHSENFNIPPTANYQEISKNIQLLNVSVGSKVILKNIFFDINKSVLRSESFPELTRVVELMKQYPKIKIEISGHTDNTGNDADNQKLSENRAKSVVEYLIQNGIPTDRLEFKGYGEVQPIADNKTEEGRQENRRVEFKVISK